MSQKQDQIISGAALLAAIARQLVVKLVIRDGEPATPIEPSRALAIARSCDCTGRLRAGRLHSMRRVTPAKPDPVWLDCYRTTQAAVFPPSAEYLHRTRGSSHGRAV